MKPAAGPMVLIRRIDGQYEAKMAVGVMLLPNPYALGSVLRNTLRDADINECDVGFPQSSADRVCGIQAEGDAERKPILGLTLQEQGEFWKGFQEALPTSPS